MDDKEKTIHKLPARKVLRILEDLADISTQARARGETEPLGTFHFRSGRDLSGQLLALDRHSEGWSIAIRRSASDGRPPFYDVTYFDASSVEAVTVHDAARYAPQLSAGTVAAPLVAPPSGGPPPPTRLALERERVELSKLSPVPMEIDWTELPASGEPLRWIRTVVIQLRDVLSAIAGDALGRESLARIKVAKIAYGADKKVVIRGDVLEIRCQPEFGSMGCLDEKALKDKIEACL